MPKEFRGMGDKPLKEALITQGKLLEGGADLEDGLVKATPRQKEQAKREMAGDIKTNKEFSKIMDNVEMGALASILRIIDRAKIGQNIDAQDAEVLQIHAADLYNFSEKLDQALRGTHPTGEQRE